MHTDDDRTVETGASPAQVLGADVEVALDASLTVHDRQALAALATSGATTPEQLARTMGISTSAAAYMQHRLRTRGLVISVPAGPARRQTVLVLSTAGRAIAEDEWVPDGETRRTDRD